MQYLQFGLPIALILWFAIAPLKGRARLAHMAMTGALIALITLSFQWLWPSAYAPVVFVVLFLLAVFLGRRRPANHRQTTIWPGVLASVLAVFATLGAVFLINARRPPAAAFDILPPLTVRAAVTEGGTSRFINSHLLVQDADTPSLSGWRGAAHAVSLQPIDNIGRPLSDPQPILAPCDGDVVGQGDDERLGSYVIIDCAGTWVVLSGVDIPIAETTLQAGAVVGEATLLTLHAQEPGNAAHPFSGNPVWLRLNGSFPARGWIVGP
ncbi:MAG: hypothetical protein ACRCS3_08220 [Paracoccaceae bacterium]